MTEKKLCLC